MSFFLERGSAARVGAGWRMATGSLAGKAASRAASLRASIGRLAFGDRRGMASSIFQFMTGPLGRALIRIKAVDHARRQGPFVSAEAETC